MNSDVGRILAAQGLRALAYGFVSVLLGASLEARGWSGAQVGSLLAAVVAGAALMSVIVGASGDRIGRRSLYAALFLGLAISGAVFGLADELWILSLVAITGTLSTEVVESGPFTSLEQVMLSASLHGEKRTRVLGTYNAVAALAGSAGALAAGGPALLRQVWPAVPADQRFFLTLVPVGIVGAAMAWSLTGGVEAGRRQASRQQPLTRSRPVVMRLSGLFAVDALAGGFVVQTFMVYWFRARFGVPLEVLGMVFFAIGLLQAGSFIVAIPLAGRIGLLNTMVFTHLPSNLLLAAIPLAPTLPVAVGLLLARFALSQMDVPTRQAYVMGLVDPEERMAAAAYTNAARYVVRPLGPVLAGASQQLALGLPFFVGGGLKAMYDLALWWWFRHVPLTQEGELHGSPKGEV